MKKWVSIGSVVFLFSCASLHTPSTHFVPSITDKNQFEGEASIGYSAASVNFAYSPLKRMTVMANVQALPFKDNSQHYQRNCELALGTYGSRSRVIYGINAGYGMGIFNWEYSQFNDSTSYSIYTKGNFQKVMLQAFLAFTDDSSEPTWFAGLSLKESFYWDRFVSLRYTTSQSQDFAGLEKNMSFEPCIFLRNFFTKKIYLNAQAGMNISYDNSMFWPTQYLFTRIGVGLKL